MGLDIEYEDGQTPLDEEEKVGMLIPPSLKNSIISLHLPGLEIHW